MSANAVNTLYTVVPGDSMTKLAMRFYGDPNKYPLIAERNSLQPTAILLIGQRLIIPAATANVPDTLPTGGAPLTESATSAGQVETVTTTASVWYKDWRYWAAIGVGAAALYYFARRGLRK